MLFAIIQNTWLQHHLDQLAATQLIVNKIAFPQQQILHRGEQTTTAYFIEIGEPLQLVPTVLHRRVTRSTILVDFQAIVVKVCVDHAQGLEDFFIGVLAQSLAGSPLNQFAD